MTDYLSNEQQKTLLAEYRAHGFKRFHSMNAAVKDCMQNTFFASYETVCFRWNKRTKTLHVYPYVYSDAYYQTRTTTKQCNKWLRETFVGKCLTFQVFRKVHSRDSLIAFNGIPVKFDTTQIYLTDFKNVR